LEENITFGLCRFDFHFHIDAYVLFNFGTIKGFALIVSRLAGGSEPMRWEHHNQETHRAGRDLTHVARLAVR